MKQQKLLVKFRVYPMRDRHRYFSVLVFNSRRNMRRFWAEQANLIQFRTKGTSLEKRETALDFNAITTGWTAYNQKGGKYIKDERNIGQILVCRPYARIGVISHEMTHAGLFWARREKFSARSVLYSKAGGHDAQHEAICWAVGNMTRQFWNRWMRYLERGKRS